MKYTQKQLNEILEQHRLWLIGEGGNRADLSYADLRSANLSSADLSSANLSYANLSSANLSSADLRYANLRSADLSSADLRSANLRSANLSSADLRYANLSYANLSSADLWSCIGNKSNIKSIQIEGYDISYTHDVMQIGCQHHLISEWFEFDDRRIIDMDGSKALKWWRKWKPVIQQIIEMSPAEPTKTED